MLHLQPGANGKATAQRQCAGIVQLAIQSITGTHQGIVSAQSGRECTLGGIDGSSADAAAQHHIRIQIDDAGGGGQSIGCNIHIQSTTLHLDGGVAVCTQNGGYIHRIIADKQVFAIVRATCRAGVTICAEHQGSRSILMGNNSAINSQRPTIDNLHITIALFQESAIAAVATYHIYTRAVFRRQLQA